MSEESNGLGGLLFILIVLGIILGTTIWMYVNFFHTSDKQVAEYYVLEKQSEKGMFFGPRYTVVTDNNTVGNYVSKEEFDSLEIGDTIKGHETFEYGFFTKMDQIYDGFFLLLLIFIIGFMFIMLLYGFIISIPAVEQAMEKRKEQEPRKKKRNWFGLSLLGVILILAIAYTSLYSLNLFHKLVPINQTTTTGQIVDREYDLNIKPRADYSTYELTIVFTAEDGETYQVKKGVTSETYNKYGNVIDLKYRNKNPYDIFIQTESIGETIGAIMNVSTVIYLLCLLIFYLLFRHFMKKRREKRSHDFG